MLCSVPGTYVGALPPLTKSDRRCEKVKVTRYVFGYSRGYSYPLATVRNSDYAVRTHLLIYTSKDVAIQSLQHRWVTGTGVTRKQSATVGDNVLLYTVQAVYSLEQQQCEFLGSDRLFASG